MKITQTATRILSAMTSSIFSWNSRFYAAMPATEIRFENCTKLYNKQNETV